MQVSAEFIHLSERPESISAQWVEEAYRALCERADGAADAESWLALTKDWNALKAYVEGEQSRRKYRFCQNMADAGAEEAARVMRDEVVPASETGDALLGKALLTSPFKHAVADHFGQQLLDVLHIKEGPLAPVNGELRVQANQLATKYDKIVAAGEVQVQGETMTLTRARGKISSEDPETRRAAYGAYYGWFGEHRDELAQIFHEQVALRTKMGENLGFDNFVPLGYAGMERTAYGPKEVAQFHAAVLEYAAPLFEAQAKKQAEALGVESLKPWDAAYFPGRSLPEGVAQPIDDQLDKIGRIFERLSPKLSAHFERMRREGLIDLANRKGKAAGAFCTSFPDEGRVAIFCNSTGDEDDIGTLAHEMGHAFQGWESQAIESVDLQWPTSDGAEVHSMGMEFLTLPYLDEFFTPDQAQKFTASRWSEGIRLLCYVCVVDAFQQWVYETPSATMQQRDDEWARLQGLYMPGIDYSGDASAYRSTRWYAQLHIFRYPFYYIDYALAETGAMQLALMDAQDHEACLETYLELCRLGGTKNVLDLFKTAGLRSPFDPQVMQDLMEHAANQL
ncbi:MAG: M3 family oligoendopeptidase [Planctomycetota bacterium]|nr:M3 family oligoendopeptidase [Planctomycetota bacterium]